MGLLHKKCMRQLVTSTSFENIKVCGLMTMAPRADEEAVLSTFTGLRYLQRRAAKPSCSSGFSDFII